MKDIKIKTSLYDRLKGVLLLVAIALGSYGMNRLMTATDTFELLKGTIALGFTIVIIICYRVVKLDE